MPRSAPAEAVRYAAFAVTAPGLAELAAGELVALGLPVVGRETGGVAFEADARGLAVANLQLRTASRVLVRLDEFRSATFHELSRRAARIDWPRWLAPGRAVRVRVTCRKSRLYHSGAVAERLAAVLAPWAGAVTTAAGNDDAGADEDDAQLLVVRLLDDRCTISIDSSGALLHQRGYRLATARAPLRETLAAALVLASGWVPGTPLVDPFCGAGTIAIEAARLARRMAPGRQRAFAFEQWPGIDPALPRHVRANARAMERASAAPGIVASDRDAGAIDATRANAERAGVAADLTLGVQAVSHLVAPAGGPPGAIVTNPPYGVRIAHGGDLRNLYARFGEVCRAQFPGWILALVVADRRLAHALRLPVRDVVRTANGGLPVTFAVGVIPGATGAP